ncbi:MAG: hypothetical protein AcusKO_01830 [Acuticoccus sp.]
MDEVPTDEGDLIDTALMVALERLSPSPIVAERAAFLLHDVFGVDFAEIGAALGARAGRLPPLAARARKHVEAARPRFKVLPARARGAGDGLPRRLAKRRHRDAQDTAGARGGDGQRWCGVRSARCGARARSSAAPRCCASSRG